MKRKNQLIIILCSLLLSSSLLSSCDSITISFGSPNQETVMNENPPNSNDNQSDYENYIDVELSVPHPSEPKKLWSGTDGVYNYHLFNIGTMSNVILYAEGAIGHDGRGTTTFEREESTTETYSEKYIYAHSVEKYFSQSLSLSASSTRESSVEIPGIPVSIKQSTTFSASLDVNYSKTTLDSRTHEQEISRIIQTKKSIKKEVTRPGYYMYAVFADCDINIWCKCNLDDQSVSYYYDIRPHANYKVDFLYSPDGNYNRSYHTYYDIDIRDLDNHYDLFASQTSTNNVHFSFPDEQKVTDKGYFGLEQATNAIELDLTSLEPFMTNEYIFEIDINMSARSRKNWLGVSDKGYRQVLLYNQYVNQISHSDDYDQSYVEKHFGLVDMYEFTGSRGPHIFEISGKDARKKMYLLFDARGNDEDTWYRSNLVVYVKVSHVDE